MMRHPTNETRAKISAAMKGKPGHPQSLETRTKISVAKMGNKCSLGYIPSPETRAKQSAAKMGNTASAETRVRLSVAHMGHVASPETCAKMSVAHLGTRHFQSLETRAKISVAEMGHAATGPKHHTPETKAKMSTAHWKGGPSVWHRKQDAKRRTLGFIPLNEPFPGCEGHHVDDEQVIHMPFALHRSIRHNQFTGLGMAQINVIAYSFLFNQEVAAAMTEVSK